MAGDVKDKFSDEVRELALEMSSGYCQCSDDCSHMANEFHHKLSNTKVNQKKFPLFLQSIFNACPISRDCHATKPLPRVSERVALCYERYLNSLVNQAQSQID